MVNFEVYARRLVLTMLLPFMWVIDILHYITCELSNAYDDALLKCLEDLESIRE